MSYSTLDDLKRFTQVEPNDLSISDSDDPQGTGDSSWDLLLQDLQDKAQDRIDSYCFGQSPIQRDFLLHESETIHLDGEGQPVLNLPAPVRSVSTVKVDDETLTEGEDYEYKRFGSLIRTGQESVRPGTYGGGGPPGLESKSQRVWPAGFNNVEVTLSFGWDDVGGTDPTRPEDIIMAEEMIVDHTLQGMLSKRESTVVQVDEMSVTVNIPVAFNREIKEILAPYKSKGVI